MFIPSFLIIIDCAIIFKVLFGSITTPLHSFTSLYFPLSLWKVSVASKFALLSPKDPKFVHFCIRFVLITN